MNLLERLYRFYHSRNSLCLVLVIFFCILLLFRWKEMNLELLPDLTSLRYFVVTEFPNHSAFDIDQTVSLPMSNQFSTLKSVKRIRTSSLHGESTIQIDLQFGSSVSEFKDGLYQLLYEIKESLPYGVQTPKLLERNEYEKPLIEILIPRIQNFKNPAFSYHTKRFIEDVERISGVIHVNVFGEEKSNLLITLNQNYFSFYPIKLRDLEFQVQAGLQSGSLGKFLGTTKETEIKFQSEIENLKSLQEFPIHFGNGEFLPLGKFSEITRVDSVKKRFTLWNGEESVYLGIAADPKQNPLRISSEIERLIRQNDQLQGVTIVSNSSWELKTQLMQFLFFFFLSFAFALLFSYLLYQNIHSVVILSLSVSFTLVLFLHLMDLFSLSINLLSLSGISVGIGMLFDANNLTYYSINSEWKTSSRLPAPEVLTRGIRSIWTSLLSSSFTTIIVFLPLLLYVHEWREFFSNIGLCIILLVFSSLLSSLFIVPLFYVSFKRKMILPSSDSIDLNSFEKLRNRISSKLNRKRVFFLSSLFIVLLILLCSFSFPKFLIYPETVPIGKTIQLIPKQNLLIAEVKDTLDHLTPVCSKNKANVDWLVLPKGEETIPHFSNVAIPLQIKVLGDEETEECVKMILSFLNESRWNRKIVNIQSEITRSLPFQSEDSFTILNENWEWLVQFFQNFQFHTKEENGRFSYEPKPITMEFWTQKKIPVGIGDMDLEEIQRRILYANDAKYLGSLGLGEKLDLFLSTKGKGKSVPQEGMEKENLENNSSVIETIPLKRFFDQKLLNTYEEYKRDSGLYYLEWIGENQLKEVIIGWKQKGFQFLEHSYAEDVVSFFLILFSLLLVSFLFVYLLLVAIYESFQKPLLHLSICFFVFLSVVFILLVISSEIHFGHYIGIVIVLGVSVDNVSLFDEKWKEYSLIQNKEERIQKVLHWLEKPILLNSGTTMFGVLPVILFPIHGMEFVRSIAFSILIGVLISLFFLYCFYPHIFSKYID